MPRLSIIADDLTGALDAAAPFAAVPGGVVVASRPEALGEALAREPAVVAVSTRSREIAPEAARERVAGVLAMLPPDVRLFKKVDSRLKGNVAAELAAFARRPMLAAPAIPEFGRIVRGGMVEGFGVDRPVAVRAMLGPFADSALVPDTASPGDLVAALDAADADAILLGARGLAAALARTLGLAPPPALPGGRLPKPAVIAVGSTDPITEAQVAELRRGVAGLACVAAPAGHVPLPDPRALAPVVLLKTAADGGTVGAAEVAARFAAGVAPWVARARSVLLTGGATAEAVFDALHETVLAVTGEAMPGMPLVAAAGRLAVTKSGGFGAPDCLLRLASEPAAAFS